MNQKSGKTPSDSAPKSEIARRREERRLAGGRRSNERWAEIVQGAGVVFRRLGYSQATLEDVAAEIGLNRATLYYYVGTKDELLVALLRDPIRELRERLDEIAARDISAREQLIAALRAYAAAMDELPELFVFLSENLHKMMSGPEADQIRENADQYGRTLARVINNGITSGEFRSDLDPQVAVLGILGMYNWIHRWYQPSGKHTLTEIGENFLEMSLSALDPKAPAGLPSA